MAGYVALRERLYVGYLVSIEVNVDVQSEEQSYAVGTVLKPARRRKEIFPKRGMPSGN